MSARTAAGLALLLAVLLAACSVLGGAGPGDRIEVLFIGNSHTFTNNVPGIFEGLAEAGGQSVAADMVAHGGWTLSDHLDSEGTLRRIRQGDWDFVVLQEQSDVPSFPGNREGEMYPAVRQLHQEILAVGAETVLFMTWGHRDGSLAEGVGGYNAESAAIEKAYVALGEELEVAIAPVGVAWWYAMQSAPGLQLWSEDGNHATLEGSYLAASVLYYAILGASPVGNDYTAGLAEDWALFYQEVAAQTISLHAERWNLPYDSR